MKSGFWKTDWFFGLVVALGYAPKQSVVSRDGKPEDIVCHLETDTVKVTAFGIARLTDSSKTQAGMVLGTLSHVSPEQIAGKKMDGRFDLFSLAVSLYKTLCGKLQFVREQMAQLMLKITADSLVEIRAISPDLPEGSVAFLDRAEGKHPGTRFQTGKEFAAALRNTAAGISLSMPYAASGGVDFQP